MWSARLGQVSSAQRWDGLFHRWALVGNGPEQSWLLSVPFEMGLAAGLPQFPPPHERAEGSQAPSQRRRGAGCRVGQWALLVQTPALIFWKVLGAAALSKLG